MTHRAVALLSGGLDSTLAVRVILDQGIEVHALNASTPFCTCNRSGRCEAERVAEQFGIPLRRVILTDEFFTVLRNPKHGYGSGMNPCLDCRILLFSKGKEYMQEIGADFLFTGEVLGQRPMSQHLRAMRLIEAEAGLEGQVLRPLSAKLLAPTLAELQGIVRREELQALRGRGRRMQMDMAEVYGLYDYPCPAGGCRLTDPGFARRMRDLLAHKADFDLYDVELLKVGRHLRLSSRAKAVAGRNQEENLRLRALAGAGDLLLEARDIPGALVLLCGVWTTEELYQAAAIAVRYSDATDPEVTVHYGALGSGLKGELRSAPLDQQTLTRLLL